MWIIVVITLSLLGFGCASTRDDLQLDTVLTLKAKKAERKRVSRRALKEEEKRLETLRENFKSSERNTPEIELLDLPMSFVLLREDEIDREKVHDPERVPPFTEAMWQDKESSIEVFMGRVDLKAERVLAMTKDQFKDSMLGIGAVYDKHYQTELGSQSNLKLRENGPLIAINVEGKFIKEGEWYGHKRYFYIYQ